MNTHTVIPADPTPGTYEDLVATASHQFEPWVRGLETPMTPAALHGAADKCAFMAVYFAYEMHFKTKAEIVAMAEKEGALTDIDMMFESFTGAKEWLEQLIFVLDGATARLLCGTAVAALAQEDAA